MREHGTGAISTVNRGVDKEINTPYGAASDDCIGCLSCANVCPTDSIPFTEDSETRTIWSRTFELSRCKECGRVLGTQQMSDVELCDACRRKAIANELAETYRFV